MLFRDGPNGSISISQPSHAWLAGQIMRAWGSAEFGAVSPYEEVCLAAEQHDIGWLAWEQSPTMNATTGRPHSFRELGIAEHTAIWHQGTQMALVFGRYPALLVSLHGTGLYANFDAASASAPDAAIVRDFLNSQVEMQHRLVENLSADQRLGQFSDLGTVERNRRLVRTVDRMSIAICTGMRDTAIRSADAREGIVKQVPTAAGETDIRLRSADGDYTTIAVTPWPFAAASLQVTCEGITLPPRRFADETQMRVALQNAKRVVMSAELVPG
jgi:hypothetical protein